MSGKFVIDGTGLMPILSGGDFSLVGQNGIGDCVCCGGPLLIWMIIDEDEAAYGGYTNQGHCGCYEEEDTAKLRELYDKYPILTGTTVCNRVKSTSTWSVHATPPGVRLRDWDRPPNVETIKRDFLNDIERFNNIDTKIYFYTVIDNSGSMTTSTVQPGWNSFINWLNNDFSKEDDRFVQVHTTSSGFPERWILFIQEPMKMYAKEMGIEASGDILQAPVAFLMSEAGSLKPIPGTHDISAWREYLGPYCKWMRDTGILAQGNCYSNYVECTNPDCPISHTLENGTKTTWKTRF